MDDGPASHATNPSESVSFDEYIPETEPAPYDLKDAFPGADSVSLWHNKVESRSRKVIFQIRLRSNYFFQRFLN